MKHRRSLLRLVAAGLVVILTLFAWKSTAVAYDTMASNMSHGPPLLTTVPGNIERVLVFRLVYAALVGSAVGWERAASKHSAGIRTMALVSLGAAVYTICSMYGFGGRGDPSRMASNVASGVGFLGAGVIFTPQAYNDDPANRAGMVSGLTTAAAIWLSAAVGVASGVGMYLTAATTAILTISTLRFGREKRKMIKKRIHRSRGTSELHDTSTWDETFDEDKTKVNVKAKKKKTIIKIAQRLPNAEQKKDIVEESAEDNLIRKVMEKGRLEPTQATTSSKRKNKSTLDDDIQPLP